MTDRDGPTSRRKPQTFTELGTADNALAAAVNTTEDQRRQAARYVAGVAHDVEDARALLAALGLLPDGSLCVSEAS